MANPLFGGEDLAADLEAFFQVLEKTQPSMTKILKDHLEIVTSTSEEKTSRSAFNAAVSALVLRPDDEKESQ